MKQMAETDLAQITGGGDGWLPPTSSAFEATVAFIYELFSPHWATHISD